jgi:hypothetical protein
VSTEGRYEVSVYVGRWLGRLAGRWSRQGGGKVGLCRRLVVR